MNDIYFTKEYSLVHEALEDGVTKIFELKTSNGHIKHIFICRKIKWKINSKEYYDITTPYGYGGPIILKSNNLDRLLEDYRKEFSNYCKENHIVSEFIRFHPIEKNYEFFQTLYNVKYLRNTLSTNLTKYDDPFQAEFSKSARKICKKLLKSEMNFKITENPSNLDDFVKIYYDTMDRNKAKDFYYFGDNYFNNLVLHLKKHILLIIIYKKNILIASGLYFKYNGYLHEHLSGTLKDHITESPAYLIRYAATEYGKKHNYNYIHYGGGTTNSKDDGLYKFKKRFSQNTEFKFYIGTRVWNKAIYEKLVNKSNNNNEEFFPAYRSQ